MATKAKHSHVLTLELKTAEGDQHADSDGPSTTTSATPQDEVTKTFTPATPDNHLIVANAQIKLASTSQEVECQLDVDGVVFHKMVHRPRGVNEWHPWSCVLGAITGETLGQFDTTSHTVKIQFRSADGSTTASIRRSKIVILRLDTFKNFYYAEALTRSIETSTSYVTKLTNAPTLVNAGNHLIFAAAHIDGTSGSGRSTLGQFTAGGATMIETDYFPTRSTGLDDAAMAFMRMETLSAGASATNTWLAQVKKGGAGPGVVAMANAAICVIELAEAGRIVNLGQTVSRNKIAYAG